MDFDASEEQVLFADSLRRFVSEYYSPEHRAAALAMPGGFCSETWWALCALGLPALSVPEERGGLGGGMMDVAIAMEALAPGLIVDPWLPTALAVDLLLNLGSAAQVGAWLDGLLSGDKLIAFAHAEAGGFHDMVNVAVSATAQGDGYLLSGDRSLVLGGSSASAVLVVARTAGEPNDKSGVSLFLVDPTSEGAVFTPYRLADGSEAALLSLADVVVPPDARWGPEGGVYDAIEKAFGRMCIALTAEAVGIASASIDVTLDHLRTRKQFGVPLSSFQVLQHRMADCAVELELARSLLIKAAILGDDPQATTAQRLRAAFGAKAFVSRASVHIAEECVQFHGAMGLTEELSIGRYLKRLLLIGALFGQERAHAARFNAYSQVLEAA